MLLTDSRQYQLHFSTKIKSIVACTDKLRSNLASENNENLPFKRAVKTFKRALEKFSWL